MLSDTRFCQKNLQSGIVIMFQMHLIGLLTALIYQIIYQLALCAEQLCHLKVQYHHEIFYNICVPKSNHYDKRKFIVGRMFVYIHVHTYTYYRVRNMTHELYSRLTRECTINFM